MSISDTGDVIVGGPPQGQQLPALDPHAYQQQQQIQQDPLTGQPVAGQVFTREDIEKARTQERDKVYGDRQAEREELARLRAEKEERERRDADAQAQSQKEADDARRAHEETELSARELIERRESELRAEMQAQREHYDAELARRDAIMQREREFAELSQYQSQVVAQNADLIVPELQDMVSGNTREEIDASVARLVERSASIIQNFQAVGAESRRLAPGASTRAPAVGPESMVQGQRTLTAQEIADMPMSEYQQIRPQLGPGRAGRSDGGMFR